MAVDKLVDSGQLDSDLEDIADAIRARGGTSAQLAFPHDFITAIGNIPSGGGGLEYEEGTWTPANDIAGYTISFANTHNVAPFYYMIADASNGELTTTSTTYAVVYSNYGQLFGSAYVVADQTQYGITYRRFRNGVNSTSGTGGILTTPYTDASSSANTNSRYWATETGIRAYYGNDYTYWRAGRTYKWIAVWTPTI